ncbi:MFS general substrate transporter [Hypomontagnella submonticulosa]|nr:MFS general substrate transporter [Hypomontagnella submonticulosa]
MTSGGRQHRRDSDEFTEASPLLPERPQRPAHRPTLSVTSIRNVHVPKVHNGATIVNLLCIIIFVGSCSSGFTSIPETRILEDVVCREHFGLQGNAGGPVNEGDCKANAIQSKVAFIMAFQGSIEAIVGFFAAFPWGLAADRIGRKPVFAINLFGQLLEIFWCMAVLYFHKAFPVELMWLGSGGLLLGGGNAVLLGIVLSMITDSTTEEERATAFMRLHVASLGGNLLSPALSSIMMEKVGPWPPIWVAVTILVICAIAFLFVPETLKHQQDQEIDEELDTETDATGFKARVSYIIRRFKESLSILTSLSLVLLLLTCLGSAPVSHSTVQFMAQFVSKRYHIKLSQTGYVQFIYGVAVAIQALLILPWLTRYIMKSTTPARFRATDEHHRDLSLARWSYGTLVLGIIILGLAPTLPGFISGLVIMGLGSGFNSLTRSLMSLYVDPEHRSRLFSLVGMAEVVGSVYSQPFLATLFALGMKLDGGWIGLPYYGLSILVTVAGSLLLFVKVPKKVRDSPSAQENGHVE